MTRLLELAAVGLGLWAISCLTMVLLARRLPPGLMRDVAEFLPACVTTAKRLRQDPSVPRRAKVALLVAIAWVVSPIDLLPEFLPVIGPLDDVVAVVLLLRYAARSIPREVLVAAWPAQPRLLDRLLGAPQPPPPAPDPAPGDVASAHGDEAHASPVPPSDDRGRHGPPLG